MGIADPAFIAARPTIFAGPEAAGAAMAAAKSAADQLAADWAGDAARGSVEHAR